MQGKVGPQKIGAFGVGGLLALIAMNLASQLGVPVDWAAEMMGVPLNAAVVGIASIVSGWMKKE